jgi:hypothetical protein
MLSVDVNGEILSPLYWAIRDGKFALAEYIIDHLLEIRADRYVYMCLCMLSVHGCCVCSLWTFLDVNGEIWSLLYWIYETESLR